MKIKMLIKKRTSTHFVKWSAGTVFDRVSFAENE